MKEWGDQPEGRDWRLYVEAWILGAVMVLGVLGLAAAVLAPEQANAHPGGTAADGCHNDRKNGDRHCHRGRNAGTKAPAPQRAIGGAVYYPNCAAARAAGAAPVRRGEPGYGSHLDRDGDGIGCE